jgi:hypothetical protein
MNSNPTPVRTFRFFPVVVLVAMIAVTTWASVEKPMFEGFRLMFAERWGVATLFDAYFGFLTFFAWVYYKERSAWARVIWLGAILFFGNIAMSIFLLRELYRLPKGAGFDALLLRSPG